MSGIRADHPLAPPAAVFTDPATVSGFLARLRARGLGCREAASDIARWLDPTARDPLARALPEIGGEADLSGIGNAYHNPQHFLDVGVLWLNLALAENRACIARGASARFSHHALLLGCCAAFGHDLLHDGSVNDVPAEDGVPRRVPFRLELHAAHHTDAILRRHGVSPLDGAAIRALILITDPQDGYDALDLVMAGAEASHIRPEFAAFRDPTLRVAAAILRDADVLPSAGLLPVDHDRTAQALARELGLPPPGLGPAGAAHFLGAQLRGRFLSEAAQVFTPQLQALMQLNLQRFANPARAGEPLASFECADPSQARRRLAP